MPTTVSYTQQQATWQSFIKSRHPVAKAFEIHLHYGENAKIEIVDNTFQLTLGEVVTIGYDLRELEIRLFNRLYGFNWAAHDAYDAMALQLPAGPVH